jgi:pimeloyl-ACP methyl ester carboxylesterase
MWRRLWLLVVLSVILSLVGIIPAAAQGQRRLPFYEKADCQFAIPEGQNVECGYVTMREDRADRSTTRTIRLAVAVSKARGSRPLADPIMYLSGGPGGYAVKNAARYFDIMKSFSEERDFIVFDQRGIGFSEPALECPEVRRFYYATVSPTMTGSQARRQFTNAVSTCHERLVEEGINLAAYNTDASAADINDLRIALGYNKLNLFGVSYGTRLALITMRRFPAAIRSVILDSTIPPQIRPNGTSALRAFNVLFERCAQDTQCNVDYPRLRIEFGALVGALNRKPVTLEGVKHPTTGQEFTVRVDGSSTTEAIFIALYSTPIIPRLPQVIYLARNGDYMELAKLIVRAKTFSADFGSAGAAYSIGCAENLTSGTVCDIWEAPEPKPDANRTVTSGLPTLILAGEFDPITPPSYGVAAGKTLRNSFYFEFPGLGHGTGFSDECPRTIMHAFLKTPNRKPDFACVSTMKEPDFADKESVIF